MKIMSEEINNLEAENQELNDKVLNMYTKIN